MDRSVRARLRLGLGGSFFARASKALGPRRLDYRMNLTTTIGDASRHAIVPNVARQPPLGRDEPVLTLIRGTSQSNVVIDRANHVLGIIPEGSQGVRLRAAQREWLHGTVPAGVLDGDCLGIAWYGVINTLPTADESVIPLVYLRAGLPGAEHRFGIAVTSTGQLWSIYNDSFGDIAGALPAVGQPVLLGITKDDNSPTTLKLYANGQLLATSGPLTHVPTNAFDLIVATNHSDITPLFGPFLDSTHYFLGVC